MKKLCGIDVTEQVYQEMEGRKYKTSVGELPIRTIELYATGRELAESEPELAAECRGVLEKIRGEILQLSAPFGGSRKHPHFSGYLADLKKIYAERLPAKRMMDDLYQQKLEQCKDRLEAADTTAKQKRAEADRAEVIEQHETESREFIEKTEAAIDAVRTALKAHVSEFYDASGEKLDDDVVKLLNSGIKLTEGEVNGLADRFVGNPTMIRLLSEYCKNSRIRNDNLTILSKRALSRGSHELETFDLAASWILFAAGSDGDVSARVWGKTDLFNRKVDELMQALDDVILKP